MGYNQSSLRAGYSVGDPFLGGIIKGIGKGIGGVLKLGGGLIGGPVGGVLGGVGGLLGGGGGPPAPQIQSRPGAGIRPIEVSGGIRLPTGIGVGGRVNLPAAPGYAGAPQVAGGGIPKGYRLNKTGYFLRSGQYVAPGTKYVKIRRTNPGNAKALRRSLRRTESFTNLVKRTRKATRSIKTL